MRKFLLVVRYEYTRQVFRWRFLMGLLSLPLFILFMAAFLLLSFLSELNFQPIGYVDHSGILGEHSAPIESGYLATIIPYDSETLAEQALQERQIQAYYVLEPDYLQTKQARLISRKRLSEIVQTQFSNFVRSYLLTDLPTPIANRLTTRQKLVVRRIDEDAQAGFTKMVAYFVPSIASFLLFFSTYTISGYLMHAIIAEKANRTMEILITSISPWQLIGGKTIGLTAVGLTQLFLWAIPLLAALVLGSNATATLLNIKLPLASLGLLAATFIPTLLMIAAIMATIGATVADHREGSLISGLFFLPIYIPMGLYGLISESPHSPLSVGLSFFPLTAAITLSIRQTVDTVPGGQIALILLVLVLCAGLTIWLAGAIWQMGALNYGRRLSLRQIFRKSPKKKVKL